MAQTVVPWIPLWAYDAWVSRGVDWLVMSEDLPHATNRVTVDADGRIRLALPAEQRAGARRLVRETKRILRRSASGWWSRIRTAAQNTTHQCGTLCFGTDPRTSVLDPFCRDARRREPVRRRRVILPLVGGGQPGPDHRGAGAAGRGSHHGEEAQPASQRGRLSRLTGRNVKARSFSHGGITVSDFNRCVKFYWEVFGCPLVGVADTPPERVERSSASSGDAPQLQDRLDSRAWRRRARDLRTSSRSSRRRDPVEPRRPDAHLVQRPQPAEVVRLSAAQGRRMRQQTGAVAARALVLFCKDFDGNLIELMDLGYMYYVLRWLGPLGGWIFRRRMYDGTTSRVPRVPRHVRGTQLRPGA